jgi:hypothetical protein
MNKVRELVITTITPNGSATLPFVIPSEAEGSAVQYFGPNEFVIPIEAQWRDLLLFPFQPRIS